MLFLDTGQPFRVTDEHGDRSGSRSPSERSLREVPTHAALEEIGTELPFSDTLHLTDDPSEFRSIEYVRCGPDAEESDMSGSPRPSINKPLDVVTPWARVVQRQQVPYLRQARSQSMPDRALRYGRFSIHGNVRGASSSSLVAGADRTYTSIAPPIRPEGLRPNRSKVSAQRLLLRRPPDGKRQTPQESAEALGTPLMPVVTPTAYRSGANTCSLARDG